MLSERAWMIDMHDKFCNARVVFCGDECKLYFIDRGVIFIFISKTTI